MNYERVLNNKLNEMYYGKVRAKLGDKCLYLTGELNNWDDVMRAGLITPAGKKYTIVNDIVFTGLSEHLQRKLSCGKTIPMNLPCVSTNKLQDERPDVLIIGCGITGYAVARELKRYNLDVILIDKEHYASEQDDIMIQLGLDLQINKLKRKYNDAGIKLYHALCGELNVPIIKRDHYLYFNNEMMKPAVFAALLYWKHKGITARFVSRKELVKNDLLVNNETRFAVFFPAAEVISPNALTNAYARNAADNGVKIFHYTAVIDIAVLNRNIISVFTNHGRIFPKLVINAAGVFAGEIAHLANDHIYPALNASPDASRRFNLFLKRMGLFPDIGDTRRSGYADFYNDELIISFGKYVKNIIHAAGIHSDEYTAVPAIALDISGMAAKFLNAGRNENFNPLSADSEVSNTVKNSASCEASAGAY